MTAHCERESQNAKYALVTAACNEERYIETALRSVVAQTHQPVKWVIVSDGSTDRTNEIVESYSQRYGFIQLLPITEPHERNFAAQVNAINAGVAIVRQIDFDFIGNLDADISFAPTYFESLLQRFAADRRLGLAGGDIWEQQDGGFAPRLMNSIDSVPHAVQLFRSQCFLEFGGYLALPYGGPDWHANVCCRMRGWHVKSFADLHVFHHRSTGGARGWLHSSFRQGLMDYSIGSHPVFELARLCRRLVSRPYILNSLVRLIAFFVAYCRRQKRSVSPEFVKYLRQEELGRLRRLKSLWQLPRGTIAKC